MSLLAKTEAAIAQKNYAVQCFYAEKIIGYNNPDHEDIQALIKLGVSLGHSGDGKNVALGVRALQSAAGRYAQANDKQTGVLTSLLEIVARYKKMENVWPVFIYMTEHYPHMQENTCEAICKNLAREENLRTRADWAQYVMEHTANPKLFSRAAAEYRTGHDKLWIDSLVFEATRQPLENRDERRGAIDALMEGAKRVRNTMHRIDAHIVAASIAIDEEQELTTTEAFLESLELLTVPPQKPEDEVRPDGKAQADICAGILHKGEADQNRYFFKAVTAMFDDLRWRKDDAEATPATPTRPASRTGVESPDVIRFHEVAGGARSP